MNSELIENSQELTSKNLDHPLAQKSPFEWMPLIFLFLLGLNIFLSIKVLQINQAAIKNNPYIYLQKLDGTVEKALPVDDLFRDESVIKNFVEDWFTLAYTWRLNDSNSFITERGIKFPIPLYRASLALAPEIREYYLAEVASRYQKQFSFTDYISGKNQSYVRIFNEPIVEQIEAGLWEVTLIAYRTHANEERVIAQEKFNHIVRVKAINPSNQRLKISGKSDLEILLDQMQDSGLQITQINQY